MDFFYLFKCIFIGVLWALAFYTLMGFVLMNFPIPVLYRIRNALAWFSGRIIVRSEKWGEKLWSWFVFLFKVIGLFIILAVLGGYAWSLDYMINKLVTPVNDGNYLVYYTVSFVIPIPFIIIFTKLFLLNKSDKPLMMDKTGF